MSFILEMFGPAHDAKFFSGYIATEFGGRDDEVNMYPLSFSVFLCVL